MAAITWASAKAFWTNNTGIWTDHNGKTHPSFAAMCRDWEKKPSTVRRRLTNSFHPWHLKMALEIPEIPGYKFRLSMIHPKGRLAFSVKIDPTYKQYQQYNGTFVTFAQIKRIFPQNMRQFKKGRLLGIY